MYLRVLCDDDEKETEDYVDLGFGINFHTFLF
jgi:hypothetical protein